MRRILLALALLFAASPALAQNYNATPGSGYVFGAKSASGILYPYFIGCDATTPTQCWAVDSSGRLTVNLAAGSTVAATLASGSVAAGAYSAGSYAAGALVAGALVDGADVTQGAKADAAYTGSGSASAIAILKGIYASINGSIPGGTATIGNVGSDPSSGKGTPSSVAINVSTATTTQLVALSGSTAIYVTSFNFIAGGTGNVTLEYGTGSNCGTGTTALTGAYPLTAQNGIANGNGLGAVLKVPAGNALCILTSAAVQVSGSLSYQQF